MSESTKTWSMVGAAVVLALVAAVARPRVGSSDLEGIKGKELFPEWKDAAAAKSLTITNVDETFNSLTEFKVADVNGRWVVPSHDDFPAIAKDRVFNLASKIIGLKVLDVVEGDKPSDQQIYGVVEPTEKALANSSTAGFGRLVVVQDADGKDLARLIVGIQDKPNAESGTSNLRFVRRSGQDRIYKVALDTDLLSTKFQDWVDTDILDSKQDGDINRILLRDFAADNMADRKDVSLAIDDKGAWSIKSITEVTGADTKAIKPPADKELDTSKIYDLTSTLAQLKLVDVTRKPASFIEELKSGKSYFDDSKAISALRASGFACLPKENPTEVVSAGGEMTIGMKDGVEYTVRFGIKAFDLKSDASEKKNDKKDSAASKKEDHAKLDRVVFVSAGFNPDLIPKAVIKPLPEAKKSADKKPDVKKPNGKTPDEKKPDEKKPDAKAPVEKLPEAKTPEPKPAGETPAAPKAKDGADKKPAPKAEEKPAAAPKGNQESSNLSGELLALADPTDDPKKAVDSKKPDDAAKPDAPKPSDDKHSAADAKTPADSKPVDKKAEGKKPEQKKPGEAAAPDKTPEAAKPGEKKIDVTKPVVAKPKTARELADEELAQDAKRKAIETANRQEQDRYDAAVKSGKKRAKELNNRLADWFYLISEDQYKKVHVGLNDIVKKKSAPESGESNPHPQNPFGNGGLRFPQ